MSFIPTFPYNWKTKLDQHRKRVNNSRPLVTPKETIISVPNVARIIQLYVDKPMIQKSINHNKDQIEKFTHTNLLGGLVQPFQNKKFPSYLDKILNTHRELRKTEEWNRWFGKQLLEAKAVVNSKRDKPINYIKNQKRETKAKVSKVEHKVPWNLLEKYRSSVNIPRNLVTLNKLLRPKIFFDLEIKNFGPLGRFIIKLYTEACPQVVLELVRVCSNAKLDSLNFKHLFPKLWLEGNLEMNSTKSKHTMEYDMRALDHNSCGGILSFPKYFLRREANINFINFAISFRPLSVLQGKRVAFGKVVEGQKYLECIQEFGSRVGKPKRDIVVSRIGLIKP